MVLLLVLIFKVVLLLLVRWWSCWWSFKLVVASLFITSLAFVCCFVDGPKPRDWSIKINRKEKQLAISTAVASAAVNTVVVEDFATEFEGKPKTKEFIEAMKRWGLDPKEKSTFVMTEVPEKVLLASRNIRTLKILTPRTLNLFDILNADKIVLTPGAVDFLNNKYGVNSEIEEEDEEEEPNTEDTADVVN